MELSARIKHHGKKKSKPFIVIQNEIIRCVTANTNVRTT